MVLPRCCFPKVHHNRGNHRALGTDFVASVAFSARQVCGPAFMRDFVTACRAMLPLVEFTTKALGLEF